MSIPGIGAGHPRPNPTAGECERSRWMAGQTRPLAIGRCRRVLASALPGGRGRPRLPVACALCVLVRARARARVCVCEAAGSGTRVCVQVREHWCGDRGGLWACGVSVRAPPAPCHPVCVRACVLVRVRRGFGRRHARRVNRVCAPVLAWRVGTPWRLEEKHAARSCWLGCSACRWSHALA